MFGLFLALLRAVGQRLKFKVFLKHLLINSGTSFRSLHNLSAYFVSERLVPGYKP